MLSMGTVFHDIVLKKPDSGLMDIEEEEEEELELPEPEIKETDENSASDNSDEEWDTDLEDTESYGVYTYRQVDDPARVIYIAACKRLNIVPTKSFLKGLGTGAINVSHQGLGPMGTKAMSLSLVKDRSTTDLNMAGNMIGHEGIRYICEMLRENDIITHLNIDIQKMSLSRCPRHDNDWGIKCYPCPSAHILVCHAFNIRCSSQDMSENDLDAFAASLLADTLAENDCLVALNLSGNRFKTKDADSFASVLALPRRHGLRELNLSHNDFGDEGAATIGHAIADNETLTKLNLSWNQIRISGIECIAKGLSENTSLKVLDISNNGVNNDGAACLSKALVQNRTLEELNLNGNRVGLVGTTNIFKSLCTNDCLCTLRLTNNPITLEGPLVALTILLKSETSVLEEFEIADACVPRQFTETLKLVKATRPRFRVFHGGFMDYRALCFAEEERLKNRWKKDPMLAFVNFIEERKLKLFDMFKYFDTDKSCTLSKDEFLEGLKRMRCPLSDLELDRVIMVLDVDKNGEIDFSELMEAHDVHKKRLKKLKSKYIRQSSKDKSDQTKTSRRTSTSNIQDTTNTLTPAVNQESNVQVSSTDTARDHTDTAVRGNSRPNSRVSSAKSEERSDTSRSSTSMSSLDSSETDYSGNKALMFTKGLTVT